MRKLVWYVLLGGVFLGSPAAAAEDTPPARLTWGPVALHPGLDASAVYDDNIFKVNDSVEFVEPTEDIYLTVNPRFELRIPYERSYLAAGYNWQGVTYLNAFDTPVDTDIWNTYNTHTVFGEISARIGKGLGLGIRDDFHRKSLFITAVDLTTAIPDDESSLKPIGMYQNAIKPTAVYMFEDSNLQVDAAYTLTSERFVSSRFDYLDKDLHVPRAKISYRFFPKTAAFVEGEGYLVRYLGEASEQSFLELEKRNADGWKGWLGMQGAITSRMTLILAGGWGMLDYEIPDSLVSDRSENASTWLGKVELKQKFSERTKLTFGGVRDFFDSYSTNYYTSGRAYGELWRSITPSIAAVVGGNYFRNKYSRPFPRKDFGFVATGKLEYEPLDSEWIKTGLGYSREQRESTLDWYSYETNQVFLEISARL